jgi:hypothetical protein
MEGEPEKEGEKILILYKMFNQGQVSSLHLQTLE